MQRMQLPLLRDCQPAGRRTESSREAAHLSPSRRFNCLPHFHLAAKAVDVALPKPPQLPAQQQPAVDVGDDQD